MTTTPPKERGILFSAPMVRALLNGTKTQTRRALKAQPPEDCGLSADFFHPTVIDRHGDEQPGAEIFGAYSTDGEWGAKFPYGQPGDRLWVRETWMDLKGTGIEAKTGSNARCAYRADTPPGSYGDEARKDFGLKWTPAIHMFRWASRITLEITSVRVERLQGISRGDAMGEGCPFPNMAHGDDPRRWYQDLWKSINGAGSWDANPWVWVVEFKPAP